MININYKKGFTLIELLVVISIIGLLSSIVMASLNTTRVKAADTAIKADLKGIAASAEIEYTTLGYKYNSTGVAVSTNACSTYSPTTNTILQNPNIRAALNHIKANNGGIDSTCNISADGKTYDIVAALRSPGNIISVNNNSANPTSGGLSNISGFGVSIYGSNQVSMYWNYNNATGILGSGNFVFEYSTDGGNNFTQFYSHPVNFSNNSVYVFTGVMPSFTFTPNTSYHFRSKLIMGNLSSSYTGLYYLTFP